MSGPVDVLAVLRELRDAHVRTNGAVMSEHDGSLARIDGAICDVAELIAAHERLARAARIFDHVPSIEGALRQSDAALARCTGGAA